MGSYQSIFVVAFCVVITLLGCILIPKIKREMRLYLNTFLDEYDCGGTFFEQEACVSQTYIRAMFLRDVLGDYVVKDILAKQYIDGGILYTKLQDVG